MKYSLIFILVIVFISSCCKEICMDNPLVVNLQNFTGGKKDSVLITGFAVNSNFSDTVVRMKYEFLQNPGYQFAIENGFTYDYEMIISSTNKVYRISDIQTKNQDCNCEKGMYKKLQSYYRNNLLVTAESIDIER